MIISTEIGLLRQENDMEELFYYGLSILLIRMIVKLYDA